MKLSRVPAVMSLFVGIAFVNLGFWTQFPVGCNSSDFVCFADPSSWWATYWPNFFELSAGFLLLSIGAFRTTSEQLSLRLPLGAAMLLCGFILFLPSIGIGVNVPSFMSGCSVNGCREMTAAGYWSMWWQSYLALGLSISLFIAGISLILAEGIIRRRSQTVLRTTTSGRPTRRSHAVLSLKLLGCCLGIVLGLFTLFMGMTYTPFPPFFLGISYNPPIIWKEVLFVSPFLLAIGFLLTGSTIESRDISALSANLRMDAERLSPNARGQNP